MKLYLNLLFFTILILIISSCSTGDYETGFYAYSDLQGIPGNEQYKDYGENPFVNVTDDPVSTFSVDADGGSYANMRRFINSGQNPPAASVRIEEYINYFTFDYPEPTDGENVSLNSELSTCPWNSEHYLLRLGMKGKSIPVNELPPSNYVFLIDVSGSMSYDDKLETLKAGFKTMVDNLGQNDRIAIVTYAGQAGVLLQSTSGSEKSKIKKAIDKLGAGGSTAGAEGIKTAYVIAEENFIEGGNNRVILGTDGDFNVGPYSTEDLVELIEEERESGVYLTVLGVGTGNLNDYMMEQVANKGNGNYEYIDNANQIKKVFTYELAKFYTVAKDARIQLTFNPDKIESYRLIGYENRQMDDEDFKNDSTDAGEIGSTQTITALYEIVMNPQHTDGTYAQFDFRYKKPDEEQSRLISHEVTSEPVNIGSASENMRFVSVVAGFGLLMKESDYKGIVNQQMLIDLAKNAKSFDPHGYRQEFVELVSK
ncbi:von Willebrand factor type A domain-containing protein [Saccharicrinis sp. FJH54]|uniref:vWA domain-containing protein n=1 Tax=Saccharicrinis sp. FJH54 TaxID=3344665 RepID=UPI0035D47E39